LSSKRGCEARDVGRIHVHHVHAVYRLEAFVFLVGFLTLFVSFLCCVKAVRRFEKFAKTNKSLSEEKTKTMKNHMPHSSSMPVLCSSDDESSNLSMSSATPSTEDNSVKKINKSSSIVSFCLDDETEVQTKVPPHVGYKKVLVTGGAGFIGSNVAEKLLARGDDVVIVDEMNDYYDVKIKETNLRLLQEAYPETHRLSIYRGDICDEEFMTRIFETEQPKWVCHMAARAGVRPSIQDPFVYIHSNIKGTTQLMELSHRYGIENFVFASSSSVYGGSSSCYFSEDENVDNPVSPYAASKKACELLAYTYHHLYQLNVSGLRFFTVYGPRGRPDMAPFKFIDRVRYDNG